MIPIGISVTSVSVDGIFQSSAFSVLVFISNLHLPFVGYIAFRQVILKHGGDIAPKNEEERCPLHLAAIHGKTRWVTVMKWGHVKLSVQPTTTHAMYEYPQVTVDQLKDWIHWDLGSNFQAFVSEFFLSVDVELIHFWDHRLLSDSTQYQIILEINCDYM